MNKSFSKISKITKVSNGTVYDITVKDTHKLLANEFYTSNCHHYELDTFIDIKNDPKKVNGANISIQLSDVFMEAVEKDEYYTQQFPVDSDTPIISKQVRARDVWAKIIHNAHKSAEPGLLNWDTVLRYSPADIYEKEGFKTVATNPCAELPLCVKDSCRLIAMNLWGFIKNPFTEHSYFDYDSFAEYTQKAQRLMDDLIDLELECLDKIIAKVESDPEPQHIKQIELDLWYGIKDKCINGRRTGLGITALGDVLAGLNVRYGSLESVEITSKIYKTLAINAYKSSAIMAGERGTFPIYNYNKEVGHPFIERLLKEDKELYDLYRRNGKRNIALLTTAPTGSISIMLKTTSGLEPAFLVEYNRSRKLSSDELKTITPDRVDALGIPWKNYTIYHHKYKMWMDITGKTKYEESPYYKAMSNDVDWVSHVDIQAAGQYWVDHSISKTINIPKDSTKELVATIYSYAWKKGLKGVTIYRDGCRDGVLNSVEQKKEEDTEIKTNNAVKRPKELPADINFRKFRGTYYVIFVGLLKDKPYEVFFGEASKLNLLDKNGIPKKYTNGKIIKRTRGKYDVSITLKEEEIIISDIVSSLENPEFGTISRLISMSLRHGVPTEFVVDQLNKEGNIVDVNKVLATVLKSYIQEGKKAVGTCDNCGSTSLAYIEKCKTCLSCGKSLCG